jgi:hypothetical protein
MSSSFNLTPAAANAAGYEGTGNVQDPSNGFPIAKGTGTAFFSETGGGNETASTTKFAHSTATLSATYYYYVPGSIAGLKFIDINGNGVQDTGDPTEAGFVIDLNGATDTITGGGNTLVTGATIAQQQATTGTGGTYSFGSLAPGTYTVTEDASNFLSGHIGFGLHQTGTTSYTVTIGADGTATVGSETGDKFANAPTPSATVTIAPDKANEVGQSHTFTATVMEDDGLPATMNGVTIGDGVNGPTAVPDLTPVTITLTASNGATPTPAGPFSGTTTGGIVTATFSSATAGQVLGNATATVVVDGQTLTPTTVGQTGANGPADKVYVDADINLSPLTATNPVTVAHTITITVEENAGNNTWASYTGPVTVSLTNDATSTATFYVGGVNTGLTTETITVTGGTGTAVIDSPTAGTVTINASVTLTITPAVTPPSGGALNTVTLTRASGDGKGETNHFDGPHVVKIYVPPVNPFTGLTPGFWKQTQHFGAWAPSGYIPSGSSATKLGQVFNTADLTALGGSTLANTTLLQALSFSGGPTVLDAAHVLLRQAVAAVLDSYSPLDNYSLTATQVINMTNTALASGNRGTILALESLFDSLNNI